QAALEFATRVPALENRASRDQASVDIQFLRTGAVGHFVSDAVMTIDAGQFFLLGLLMPSHGDRRLFLAIHVRHCMAMAAFPRVIAFHVGPYALGHFRALGLELLSRVHRVRDVMAPKV